MSDKTRLQELNVELGKILAEMQVICVTGQNRSIMIKVDSEFNESFGTIIDSFEPRLDHFRNKISRIADNFPKKTRKSRK